MKKILLQLCVALLLVSAASAQAPGIFNYQAVARNSVGNALSNKNIGVKITVHDGSATGPSVYSETRTLTTNPFGLFNVQIGNPGASNVSGTIAGVNWATGTKFLQVEMDQNGGSSFVDMGTTQLASVPFSLNAAGAPPIGPAGGDLVGSTYPNPTIAPLTVTTGKIANTAVTTAKIADLNVTTAKIDDGAVTSQKITVPLVKVQADAGSLIDMTNSGAGTAVSGTNTGTGFGGLFQVNNAASTADGLRATTNGTGASWAIRGISTGTNGAGLFQQTNAINTSNNLQSNQAGLGRAGLFNSTNVASTANSVDINVAGTGFALRAASTNAAPKALLTVGGLQLTGIGEAANRVLVTDAAGNATWQAAGASGAVTGSGTLNFLPKWSPSGTVLGNSMFFDDGNSVAMGTTSPSHRFTVSHGGSTGIGVTSTSGFSVVDINAASGDAALRFQKAGVNQWNLRNDPANDNLQFFELGGGGSRMVIQDATGNVGIGPGTAPSYKLDVEHGGSTGIRSKSTSSFSVVDIDAKSGDAALRFANDGTNQWNMRNRPSDNYLEIFELGGGGSRLAIQDGTGNVGIGNTSASIAYRLDVEHGGSTGIRSKSTASFSVVDIDAASGDAALRFQKAGVNQWNMRNDPSNDNLQFFELGGGGSRMVIQDATGNVGIGPGTAPAYRLDVEHGGSTGIRSKSTASFSVVDIDAASGDAALRFQKAGVNQWNMRNDPANDNLQFFELGGGGSRMVIQDATGNVGIGPGTAPAYRLDVEHGGSTGIRSRSTASFSVVDIDGQSGDAALRFQKAGVNQWNTRNNPGTDDYQIFELGGGGERMRIDNTTGKVWVNGDFTVVGVKAFTMDHPLDPTNKTLMHAAAESNEVINFYSGNVTTDASGKAMVNLPDYFEAINKDFRYQLTVIGGTFAQAIISKEVSNNKFEIATNQPNVKVSWEVKGVRNDAHMRKFPFVVVEEKSAAQKGRYIDPAAYNQPESKRVSYSNVAGSSLEDVKPDATKAANPLNTSGGSLQDAPVDKTPTKKADVTGSVVDVPAAAKSTKIADVTGSVVDVVKKEDKKPVAKSTEKGSTEE
jgi:predicted lipoprotein with Yx(FWY)xxD motif